MLLLVNDLQLHLVWNHCFFEILLFNSVERRRENNFIGNWRCFMDVVVVVACGGIPQRNSFLIYEDPP